ncbi:probable u3 small nucleolar RNA-associated 11 [Babesia ovata]|uniref:Probable u3 small nucleolar RNA-associated 11 n=1 Tax=Babesia ovata TaxID=189622 RepID=A0A2H6KGU2_9APIC|nr:probable u3 small nucleolar RNA-associated 11 [Babesia ovata]GBE62197.1 probable u3 small nucleolar RNA-associated 11 [Babesia ovata]
MAEGLRHVVHRRVHLERSQPQARRARVGQFLEKKRDYKQRAERFHVMERRIRDLAAKARFRNEDEFNFKMVHGKLGDDGVVVLPSSSSVAVRKLDKKGQFRRSLEELDQNRFVLRHRSTVKGKRAQAAVTENATLLMDGGKHVTFDDSSDSDEGDDGESGSAAVSDTRGDSSDSEQLSDASEGSDSDSTPAPKTKRGKSSKAGSKADASTASRRSRATKRVREHLIAVSETIEAKRADDELRQRLDAERELRVAVHKKRQVRRARGSNVHVFPFERQK